jgi:hypothetical protein
MFTLEYIIIYYGNLCLKNYTILLAIILINIYNVDKSWKSCVNSFLQDLKHKKKYVNLT